MSLSLIHAAQVFPRRVRVLVEHLARIAPKEVSILDVGSGDGSLAAELKTRRGDIQISGIDVVPRERTSIPVTLFDGKRIPFPDESFDAVMFIDVLHHTTDPEALLAEARRVSRRWILLKDHNRDGLAANETLRLMDWVGNARYGVPLPYNYLSRAEWSSAFQRQDLAPKSYLSRLGLYPAWGNWVFGRDLHFITLLEKRDRRTSGGLAAS